MRDPELPANPGRVEPGRTPGHSGPGVRPSQTPRGEEERRTQQTKTWRKSTDVEIGFE